MFMTWDIFLNGFIYIYTKWYCWEKNNLKSPCLYLCLISKEIQVINQKF